MAGGAGARLPLAAVARLAAAAALLGTLFASRFFPTGDGPQHVMMGHIENHFDDPGTPYRHFLLPAAQFAGRGFAALFVPLEARLPWPTATWVAVALSLSLWAGGFAALVAALSPRRWVVGLLGVPCAFQWSLYLGQYAFVVGTACGFFLLALVIAGREPGRGRMVVVGLLLLLQSILHLFSALLSGALVLVLLLSRAGSPRAAARAALGWSLCALPAGAVLLASLLDAPRMARTIREADQLLFVPLVDKLAYLPRCFQPGEGARGAVTLALALFGIARALVPRRRAATLAHERALAACALGLLVLAVVAPLNVPGWQLLFPRFLPLGTMLGLALLDVERAPRPRLCGGLSLALVALAALSLLSAARLGRKLRARCADALAGLQAPLSRSQPRLVVVRDSWAALSPRRSPVPFLVPLRSLGGLYVAAQGGIIADMFVGAAPIHAFVWRPEGFRDFPDIPDLLALQRAAHLPPSSPARRAVVEDLAAHGSLYQDVVLYTDPADTRPLADRGYLEDLRRGDLYIGRFRGCRAELWLPAGAGPAAVSYAWWPRPGATWRRSLDGLTPAADGWLRVPLERAPCGEIAVTLEGPADGPGPRCLGLAADGALHARLSPETATEVQVLRCQPPAAGDGR